MLKGCTLYQELVKIVVLSQSLGHTQLIYFSLVQSFLYFSDIGALLLPGENVGPQPEVARLFRFEIAE